MHALLQTLIRQNITNRSLGFALKHGDTALVAVALLVLAAACFS